MTPAERAREIVNAVFSCIEGVGCAQIIFHDVRARELVSAALAAQAAQTPPSLDDKKWLRITQVHELVKQEGDARCEAAFDDLIAALNREAAQTRALETALGEAIDGYEEFYLRLYPEGPKSICVPAWRAALTGAPREPA